MKITISQNRSTPIYQRIAEAVCEAVASGQFLPGQKLPTESSLARDLGIHALTVSRAYQELEGQGIVQQRRGSGTYVGQGAAEHVSRLTRRRLSTIHYVIGEESLARCYRSTLFIVANVLDGMRDVLGLRDTHIALCKNLTLEDVAALRPDEAVALSITPRVDQDVVLELMRRRTPTVFIGGFYDMYGVAHVSYDRQHAAMLACQHLIDCGYRRIGFIGVRSYPDSPVSPKFAGYSHALSTAGLDMQACYVRSALVSPGQAFSAARQIIASGNLPEAFFVDTDYKAMEVITALEAAGLRVPEDVAIAAYDDVPEAAHFSPPLTSVRVPWRKIGNRAARLLCDWPSEGNPTGELLKAELVVRGSTRLPAAKSSHSESHGQP